AFKDPKILGTLNEKQISAIESIEKCAKQLKKLIGDVLDAQKLDIGKLKIKSEKFPIQKLIDDIEFEFKIIAKAKNIDFAIHCPNNFDLDSDLDRIKQVIRNLLNNAKDFVPEKNGKISLTIKEDDGQILFSVSDNGIGITKEQQQDLFQKFYQIDTSVTREHQGSGLGLSICKGIVEMLGGKIWVESQKNEGSTFYFTLPIKKEVYNK
ncbi:MAG: HAMP domain-containing sensor histidine kinase, partial [Nitrosopumilaceae archaeon]|nr:HAMP domain-containing sensor histidine kinase [Nitrosopumilaceae archaeon]